MNQDWKPLMNTSKMNTTKRKFQQLPSSPNLNLIKTMKSVAYLTCLSLQLTLKMKEQRCLATSKN